MKKFLYNSYITIIWLMSILLGYIVLLVKASFRGEYAYNAFHTFQTILTRSSVFWMLVILLIVHSIISNFGFKQRKTVLLIINAATILVSIVFFFNISHEIMVQQQVYHQLEMNTESGLIVSYKLPCFILMIVAIILITCNTLEVFKDKS